MLLLLILIILKTLFQGEATGINDNNNVDNYFTRLKETIRNKEAELKTEIITNMMKLEDTKINTFTRIDENVNTFFDHLLLKEKTNCIGNEKTRIIKDYSRQFSLNIKSCVNFTQSLADTELLLYSGVKLLKNISAMVTDVVSTLIACETKGPVLKYICYMKEFDVIQKDLLKISESTSVFVDTVENMMSILAAELKQCFYSTKVNFLAHTLNEVQKKLNSCE